MRSRFVRHLPPPGRGQLLLLALLAGSARAQEPPLPAPPPEPDPAAGGGSEPAAPGLAGRLHTLEMSGPGFGMGGPGTGGQGYSVTWYPSS
jgi:hypothetical protein